MSTRAIALGAVLAGCYGPRYGDCLVRCSEAAACPDGLTCSAGFCVVEGAGPCSGGDGDGAPGTDGAPGGDGAPPQPDAAASVIQCGGDACAVVDEWCCVPFDGSTPVCSPSAGCSGYPVYCDGPEDCPDAGYPVCCFAEYGAYGACTDPSICAPGAPEFWIVCHTAADCPGSDCLMHPTLQLQVCR